MKTKKEKISLLNKTIKFYSSNKRCVTNVGNCQYYSEETPHGCAIGRLFKTAKERFDFQWEHPGSVETIFNNLPSYVKAWGKNFLIDLQNLHDRDRNWSQKGDRLYLSKEGTELVKNIKKDHNLI